MVALPPALQARGFEPVVFHATGMGGRADAVLAVLDEWVAPGIVLKGAP